MEIARRRSRQRLIVMGAMAAVVLAIAAPRLLAVSAANLANVFALEAAFGSPERTGKAALAARQWAERSLRWRENRSAWLAIARASHAAGDADGAAQAYARALEHRPAAPYWFVLGTIERSAGHDDRAVAAWSRANAEARFTTVGKQLASRGSLDEAAELLSAGRQAYPRSGPIALALADVMRDQKQDVRAIELYEAAGSIDGPHQPAALLQLGHAHYSRAEWTAASTAYEQCADLSAATAFERAECLVSLAELQRWIVGDDERAFALIVRALSEDPRHGRALVRRGELNMAAGRATEARADFERALDANEHDPYVLAMLGVAQARVDGTCLETAGAVERAAGGLIGGSLPPLAAAAVFEDARDDCRANPYFTRAWVFTFAWAGDEAGYRQAIEWARQNERDGRWLPF
jgi:tetratricopeptide (TPR) repeat protein